MRKMIVALVIGFVFFQTSWSLSIADWQWKMFFRVNLLSYNNMDLRDLDASSFTAVENTDDRIFLVSSEVQINTQGSILNNLDVFLVGVLSGYWGNDSLSYQGGEHGLDFSRLMLRWDLASVISEMPFFQMFLDAGRFTLSTSEEFYTRHYIFKDTVDAVRLYWLTRSGWGMDSFFDFYGLNSPVYGVFALDRDRQPDTQAYFDGNVNTYRMGFILFYRRRFMSGLLRQLEWDSYVLYSRIGASGKSSHSGGSETTYGGLTGNTPDGDWLINTGSSLFLRSKIIWIKLEGAYAWGRDFKSDPGELWDIAGIMLHAAGALDWRPFNRSGGSLGAEWLYSQGAYADAEGKILQPGFVSFKGDRVGGCVMRDYWGMYPSAFLNNEGIDMSLYSASRRAGLIALHTWQELRLEGNKKTSVRITLDQWWYQDNNVTLLDFSRVDLNPQQADQKRWGLPLGLETDMALRFFVRQKWQFGMECGIFFPDRYFSIPQSHPAPWGNDPCYMMRTFCELTL